MENLISFREGQLYAENGDICYSKQGLRCYVMLLV